MYLGPPTLLLISWHTEALPIASDTSTAHQRGHSRQLTCTHVLFNETEEPPQVPPSIYSTAAPSSRTGSCTLPSSCLAIRLSSSQDGTAGTAAHDCAQPS